MSGHWPGKEYLGDSVYAEFDGLEPEVLESLFAYRDRVRETLAPNKRR